MVRAKQPAHSQRVFGGAQPAGAPAMRMRRAVRSRVASPGRSAPTPERWEEGPDAFLFDANAPLHEHTTQGSHAHGIAGYHHSQSADDPYYFWMPTTSILGQGAIAKAAAEIKRRGLTTMLIVTDAVLVKVGTVGRVTDELEKHGIAYIIYDQVLPNPTCEQVQEGARLFAQEACEGIISIGGGSPHDAAKGIGLVAGNPNSVIADFEGVDKAEHPMVPVVAINTTAGTGSEMTRFCIITDEKRHVKVRHTVRTSNRIQPCRFLPFIPIANLCLLLASRWRSSTPRPRRTWPSTTHPS